MAGGLIGTGEGYQNTAVSGLVRESAEQQQIDQANAQIKAQQDMAEKQMIGEIAGAGLGLGAMFLFAGLF